MFTAVRSGIKAFTELRTVQWLDDVLTHLQQSSHQLFTSNLNETLMQILSITLSICPSEMAIMKVDFNDQANQGLLLFHSDQPETEENQQFVVEFVDKVESTFDYAQAGPFSEGYLLPLILPYEMGKGWLYLTSKVEEMAMAKALFLLSNQATLAIYSTIVQQELLAYQGAEFLED